MALTLAQVAKAELVKPEVAAQYAQGILGMKEAPSQSNRGPLRAPKHNGQSATPEFYVFNNPDGGWVIISAEDRVRPVIAYSPEGSFDTNGMPENLEWWMNGVAEYVEIVRNSDLEASAAVKSAWESLPLGGTTGEKKELMTAKWSQNSPFNDMCPVVNSETSRSLAGCVAVAMSIVMQYNKWPAHGKGVIGGYTTSSFNTYVPPFSIDNHVYDWDLLSDDNMLHGKTGMMSSEQKQQVAQLVYDCGVAVQMDFSSEFSGSTAGKMLKALVNNMSYSESATIISRSAYSLDKWFSILKNEIDQDRVVFYDGMGDGGGHAFVCDGYDTNGNMVHINWGWGDGDINGFFTLDLTLPKRYGFGFSEMQEAVIYLAPETKVVVPEEKSGFTMLLYRNLYGMQPATSTDVRIGSEFSFKIGWLQNNTPNDIVAEFKVCLMDKDGAVKQEGWSLKTDLPASNGYIYNDETNATILMVTPEITDYFQLFTKEDDQWKPMWGNYDLLPGVDGVFCGVTNNPVILVNGTCAAGQEVDLSLTYGFTDVKTVKWTVNGTVLDSNKVTLVSGTNAIVADVEYMDGTTGYINYTLEL